jgi:hypothetical protein
MALALRTATRLQDQDDVNVTPGPAVDGYALTWDNGAGEFVATAVARLAVANTFTAANTFQNTANSIAALAVNNAAGNPVLVTDTTNRAVGVNSAPLNTDILRASDNSGAVQFYIRKADGKCFFTGAFAIGGGTYPLSIIQTTFALIQTSTGDLSLRSTTARTLIYSYGSRLADFGNSIVLFTSSISTAGVKELLNLTALGSGANGDGGAVYLCGKSSTTAAQDMARIQWLWNDATHATRKADLVFSAFDTAEREGMRIRGGGSEPAIGFYGVAPVARQLLATGGGATVDQVITALQNLGLLKQA